MKEEKLKFETEVSRLLHIVANSLYSQKEIFLRELISNASDACDRLRYEAITKPDLIADDPEFRVQISIEKKKRIIEISDNGIGMNREALISDLGTIARSGTTAYLEEHQDDDSSDLRGFIQHLWLLRRWRSSVGEQVKTRRGVGPPMARANLLSAKETGMPAEPQYG